MAQDAFSLYHVAKELNTILKGAKVNRVSQPDKDDVYLITHSYTGNRTLVLSSNAENCRIAFTKEEILYMAEICCGKYHRIRKDGDFRNFDSNEAKNFYKQYYDMTGSEEVKYILENFDEFKELCLKSILERQRDDDFAPYREDSKLSTSRDPDSEEWKGKR